MGTSCMFSVRRCAVTVISAIPSDSVVSAAAAAYAGPMGAAPLKMAAIAYDNFWFEFMRPSLLLILCDFVIIAWCCGNTTREPAPGNVTMSELIVLFGYR